MTAKEALKEFESIISMQDILRIESNKKMWNIIKREIDELERLKVFKKTFDNYELAKKQDFIAYENWQECEKELKKSEELKSLYKECFDYLYNNIHMGMKINNDKYMKNIERIKGLENDETR